MDRKLSYEELIQKVHDLEAEINRKAKETGAGRIKALDIKENAVIPYDEENLTIATEMQSIGLSLAYVGSDIDDDECGGGSLCEGRVVLSVSKSL